ncbi:peptidase S8 and S53, subtilisin, kexin, sedolisin [Flavobacteriales bacterium ALC-1]|nr:peptidase S8 and S53, subtilisin, kexin, sedolisin [Flavobacteriales bacterium ALC-1]
MKRNTIQCILLLFFFSFCSFLNSQNSNRNLSKANTELLKQFEEQEQKRINRVEAYFKANPTVSKSIDNGKSQMIYIYDIIDGKPIYRATDNLEAARGTKTSHLQSGGSLGLNLDGSGMTIGVWDGGPAEGTHLEFSNTANSGSRLTMIDALNSDGSAGPSTHGTHVSGTIASKGTNAQALGMAPNVNVKSYNWNNDESEMVVAATDPTAPILVSNHSYGVPVDPGDGSGPLDSWIMGAYTQSARNIDNIISNNPQYLVVASAGNAGNTTYPNGMFAGYDKLTTDKNAKNSLVIANANPSIVEQPIFSGNYEISSLAINSGSSQGPTDDLRVKPDLAADGTNLLSTVPSDNYAVFSGTSMASPNTAGTLILLQQYYNQLNGSYMNASTLKGLVCHTSLDDITTPGPDPIFGWGFLDAKASAETIAEDNNSESIIEELNLSEGQTYTYTFSAQAGENLKATICWTDIPGAVSTGVLNDPTPRLVNDLDLRLTKDGTTFLPWKLDYSPTTGFSNSKGDNIVDNIEVVDIDVPESGNYTLTVTHKGTLQGNVGGPFDPQSQNFSLIVTGNNLTLGTTDNKLSNAKIWPNPSTSVVNVNYKTISNQSVSLLISDLQGRVVYNNLIKVVSSEINERINVSSFSKGTYILSIKEGTNVINHKIIVD